MLQYLGKSSSICTLTITGGLWDDDMTVAWYIRRVARTTLLLDRLGYDGWYPDIFPIQDGIRAATRDPLDQGLHAYGQVGRAKHSGGTQPRRCYGCLCAGAPALLA